MDIDLSKCPICQYPSAKYSVDSSRDTYQFNCPRCKKFIISQEALMFGDIQKKIHLNADKLSGLTRLLSVTGARPMTLIFASTLDAVLSDALIPDREDIIRKSEILVDAIKRESDTYGKLIELAYERDYSMAFAANTEEFMALLDFLEEQGYIKRKGHDSAGEFVSLTAAGWQPYIDKQKTKQGFIAVWFDEKGTMNRVIEKTEEAIRECGYQPMCIKEKHYAEPIIEKSIGEIKKSRFIVVNLTEERKSVFYEAGYAHGIGLDIIYVCDKAHEKAPDFYSKHYKIYFYSTPEELKLFLIDAIKARIN